MEEYRGRGWKLISFHRIKDAPEWVAAPIVVFGSLILLGLLIWLIARTAIALATGSADDIYKLILSLAGVIGAPFVAWRTIVAHQQTVIARESHYTSLFTRAVEQLGATREVKRWTPPETTWSKTASEASHRPGEVQTKTEPNLEVRLGAIYALDRIAKDSQRDHWSIMQVLCAYVRSPQNTGTAIQPEEDDDESQSKFPKPRVDVQAAVTVIGSRRSSGVAFEKQTSQRLDFSEANLQRMVLSGDFEAANFHSADLSGADIDNAKLSGANFFKARLRSIDQWDGAWNGVRLNWSKMRNCSFMGTSFNNTHFYGATIHAGYFGGCTLESCAFSHAEIIETNFSRCNLKAADFSSAKITESTFDDSDLTATLLYDTDLSTCSGLTTEQLSKAHGDKSTKLPEDMQRPLNWPDRVLEYREREPRP